MDFTLELNIPTNEQVLPCPIVPLSLAGWNVSISWRTNERQNKICFNPSQPKFWDDAFSLSEWYQRYSTALIMCNLRLGLRCLYVVACNAIGSSIHVSIWYAGRGWNEGEFSHSWVSTPSPTFKVPYIAPSLPCSPFISATFHLLSLFETFTGKLSHQVWKRWWWDFTCVCIRTKT